MSERMCDREVCVSGLRRGFFSQFPGILHESRRRFRDNVVFKVVFARHECKRRQKNCLNKALRSERRAKKLKSKSMNGIGDEYNSQSVVGDVRAAF